MATSPLEHPTTNPAAISSKLVVAEQGEGKDDGVRKYLDVSTANITEKDMALLDHNGRPRSENGVIAIPHSYGAFVHVPYDELEDRTKEIRQGGFSEDFMALLEYARSKGCFWINLDSDAEPIEGLHKNNW